MLLVLPGVSVRMPETEIHRKTTSARHMRPYRIKHRFTTPPFVPTPIDEFTQIAAALRAPPGIGPLNCRTVGSCQGVGRPTCVRKVMAQKINEIPYRRKPKTEVEPERTGPKLGRKDVAQMQPREMQGFETLELSGVTDAGLEPVRETLAAELRDLDDMPQVKLTPGSVFDCAKPLGSVAQLRGVICSAVLGRTPV